MDKFLFRNLLIQIVKKYKVNGKELVVVNNSLFEPVQQLTLDRLKSAREILQDTEYYLYDNEIYTVEINEMTTKFVSLEYMGIYRYLQNLLEENDSLEITSLRKIQPVE